MPLGEVANTANDIESTSPASQTWNIPTPLVRLFTKFGRTGFRNGSPVSDQSPDGQLEKVTLKAGAQRETTRP